MVLECLIIVLDSLGKYTPILCASLLNCKVPGGRHSRGAVTEDGPEVLCQPNLLGVPVGETELEQEPSPGVPCWCCAHRLACPAEQAGWLGAWLQSTDLWFCHRGTEELYRDLEG